MSEPEYIWPRQVGKLVRISKEQADYMLNVLPPIYGNGCFAVSEPQEHTDEGKPRYHWVQKRGDVHVCTMGTRQEAAEAFKQQTPA